MGSDEMYSSIYDNETDFQNPSNSTYCKNVLATRLVINETQCYIFGMTIAVVTIITLTVNGLLLFAIIKTKAKAACNMHIIITTVNGCFSAFSNLPMYTILFTFYHNERQCLLETISIFVAQIETHVLAYSILALAIDRYVSVRPDFGWSKSVAEWMQSRTGSTIIAIIIVVLSLLHGLVTVDFFVIMKTKMARIVLMLFNGIIGIIVYVAYLKLYCEITVHKSSLWEILRANRAKNLKDRPCNETPIYLREFIKTISILLVAGAICYIPFIIMDFWTGWYTFQLKTGAPQDVRFAYYMSVALVFIYSPVNASLFIYRNGKIRQFFKTKFQSFGKFKDRNKIQCLSLKRFNELGFLEMMGHRGSDDLTLGGTSCKERYATPHKKQGHL